jgi:lipopolysaccharide/colanic/teichoic acid biosynthesis glycosyltransferase
MPEPTTMLLVGSGLLGVTWQAVRRGFRRLKPVADFVLGLVTFLVLTPILLALALLVRCTSRGPVLYSQWRVGQGGRLFRIHKFRTMRVGAEQQTGPTWAAGDDDPRLTPVGGWLRRHHLDELPQLLNVLRGEMSLVGPRPERPVFVRQFAARWPDYLRRLQVRPGITGLAQVLTGYDRTVRDVRRKLAFDLFYIRRMCWWLDMRILWRTARVALRGG